ncbi:MAG: FliM/FliN family flagellar motor switch protein [Salinibacterium sp.]|nr:FliM/FliN family flagellar motor switch protein [Salinibacterium sp.]
MKLRSQTLLSIQVPVIVYLAERSLTTAEVMRLVPGSIIEMPKKAEEDLELFISNRSIASGEAVKVGENFGIRLTSVGTPEERLAAAIEKAAEGAKNESAA